MDPFMTELFGRGSREGLLHWVKDGTVAINNVHKAVSANNWAHTHKGSPVADPSMLWFSMPCWLFLAGWDLLVLHQQSLTLRPKCVMPFGVMYWNKKPAFQCSTFQRCCKFWPS